jgi:hypothetical protein
MTPESTVGPTSIEGSSRSTSIGGSLGLILAMV